MALTTYSIAECAVGIFEVSDIAGQAVWGTATAATSDALELNVKAFEVDRDIKKRVGKSALTGTRNDDVINHQTDTYGTTPRFGIKTEGGVLKDELAFFLYGNLQSVTEAETTPFKKDFILGNPDFTASAGYFATFCFKAPDASHSIIMADCTGTESLKFSCAPGGFLEVEQAWQSRGAATMTGNPSTGSWDRAPKAASDYFAYENMTFKIGSTPNTVLGALEWEFTRETSPIGVDDGKHSSLFLGDNTGTIKGRVLYGANGQTLESAEANNTYLTAHIYWGTEAPAADGDLHFTLPFVVTETKRVEGEAGIFAVDFTGRIVGDSTNETPVEMITVNLCDTQDMGW